MRAFRDDTGNFDLKRYNDIVQNSLGSLGFSEAQIEELAADQIRLDRVKELLSAGVTVSPAESKTNFEQLFSKFEVSVVRLKTSEVASEVKISDDEIAKYYEGAKEQLKSEEKRKIQFVALALSEAEKKLTGKERIDALQKLSDKANDVAQALAEKNADFAAIAVKFQLPVKITGDFSQIAPDPELKQDSQLIQAAFQLSNDEPISEPIQGADGFYILHLVGITAARPLTLVCSARPGAHPLRATPEEPGPSGHGKWGLTGPHGRDLRPMTGGTDCRIMKPDDGTLPAASVSGSGAKGHGWPMAPVRPGNSRLRHANRIWFGVVCASPHWR
jgi:hypothetical protein